MCCLKCHRVIIISTKTAVHVKIRHPSDDESSETQQKKKTKFDRPIKPFNYGEISEETARNGVFTRNLNPLLVKSPTVMSQWTIRKRGDFFFSEELDRFLAVGLPV
jgi:hypothetical protein